MPVLYGVHPVESFSCRPAAGSCPRREGRRRRGSRTDHRPRPQSLGASAIRASRRIGAARRLRPAHEGVVALGAADKYADLDETTANAKLLVILDGVEDRHDLGAIARTAHAAGADAILIPARRAAGLTDTGRPQKLRRARFGHLPVVGASPISTARWNRSSNKATGSMGSTNAETDILQRSGMGYADCAGHAEDTGLHRADRRKKCDVLCGSPWPARLRR